ncbi:MAG: AMP-binding protein [Lachnospiraceae bacterium]|nr:AMP-binding protein [Lachnospiraceae bacterium]
MSFYDSFEKFADKIAFLDDRGQCITYGQLKEFSNSFGGKLKQRTLVFCLCENSLGSAAGYLSFLRNRVVPLMIDRKIDTGLFDHLMEVYRPEWLYFPADMEAQMKERITGYQEVHREYEYILASLPGCEEDAQAAGCGLYDELGLLLTTSGSTGSPKLVRQSYRNIQSNAEAIAAYLELDDTERPVSTLPMNYTYGLSVINSHVQVGATILLTDKTMAMKQFWDFMINEKATSFPGVPFTYELLKKVHFFRMKLPDLRYMTQAGGKLSPELHREFAEWCQENGKKFIVMYGQTEATARMGYLPAGDSIRKYGSMGKEIPGGTFTLVDVDGSEIMEPEKVGELVYKGDNVTLGYAQCREDLAKGDERGGVLVTGDMAKRDEEGYYYIVGRKKRFLKIFGNRVNLDEIDRLIKTRFEGIDCASAGVDDRMTTFITDESKIAEVRRYLAATTHLSESAFDVRYLAEIPKNESGKTLYKELPR